MSMNCRNGWVLSLAVVVLTCFLPVSLKAAPIATNSSVLFLGHGASDYMAMFTNLYAGDSSLSSLNLSFSVQNVTSELIATFYTFKWTDNYSEKSALMRQLSNNDYDYIVLIPDDDRMKDCPELCMEGARQITVYLRMLGKDTQVLYVMPWNSSDAVTWTSGYEEHSYRIADALDLKCLPAGLAWDACMQDSSLNLQDTDPSNPSGDAQFIFASTLFAHFFEKDSSSSSYDYSGFDLTTEAAAISHAYNTWDTARSATHYTGDYTNGAFRSFTVPHVFDGTTWCSMGTSSEGKTKGQLATLVKDLGLSNAGSFHINGYNYNDQPGFSDMQRENYKYFYKLLTVSNETAGAPSGADIIASKKPSFGFGRRPTHSFNTDYAINMNYLHGLTGGEDTRFITIGYVYSGEAKYCLQHTTWQTQYHIEIAKSHPDSYAIPNFFGMGRAWMERPDIEVNPQGAGHLSSLGYFVNAAMLYTIATGNEPFTDSSVWNDDKLYLSRMAYKNVMELAGLKKVALPPLAYRAAYTNESEQPMEIALDGIDFDGYPVSALVTSGPSNGSLSGSGSTRTYTPDSGFSGTDTLAFKVHNGTLTSEVATVTIEVPATGPQDNDNDHIDDAWETAYFGSTGTIDGTADSDGDGDKDFFEYLYGSDPTTAASSGFYFRVNRDEPGSGLNFEWETEEGFAVGSEYSIQISTNLISWTVLPTNHYSLIEAVSSGMAKSTLTLTADYGPACFLTPVQGTNTLMTTNGPAAEIIVVNGDFATDSMTENVDDNGLHDLGTGILDDWGMAQARGSFWTTTTNLGTATYISGNRGVTLYQTMSVSGVTAPTGYTLSFDFTTAGAADDKFAVALYSWGSGDATTPTINTIQSSGDPMAAFNTLPASTTSFVQEQFVANGVFTANSGGLTPGGTSGTYSFNFTLQPNRDRLTFVISSGSGGTSGAQLDNVSVVP